MRVFVDAEDREAVWAGCEAEVLDGRLSAMPLAWRSGSGSGSGYGYGYGDGYVDGAGNGDGYGFGGYGVGDGYGSGRGGYGSQKRWAHIVAAIVNDETQEWFV